jgi:transposase InsO family protein
MKWSDTSGPRVKAVKCHNEVRNDNRNEKETGVHGRFQAGCRGTDQGYKVSAAALSREYVAVYYNSKRLHSTLGYKTPLDYEKNLGKVSGIT